MKRGWKAVCDRCGFWFHSYELRRTWDGLMVHDACYETRHPQDFVKGIIDKQTVPWTRPEPTDVFTPVCYLEDRSCYTGFGVAGCMIAGNQTQSALFLRDLKGIK